MLAELPLIATCRVLAAAIRVVQPPHRGRSVCQRHGEGPLGQLCGQPMVHGAHPITVREYKSSTTARESQPSVG